MKKHVVSALLVGSLLVTSAFAQVPSYIEASPDIGPQIQIALPGAGDYDLYESGIGLELQFRDWVSLPWGYLLAIGYAEWQADADATSPGANLYDYDGNLEIIPFGGSIIYQPYADDKLALTLEGGFRYLIVESKITARNSDQSPANRYDVNIEDAMVVRVGADLDYTLNDDFILSFGVSYQKDFDRGELSTELGPGRDNIMESFLIDVALRMPL